MSDVCSFLRESAEQEYHDAADEIERLRAENAKVRSLLRWDIVEDEEGLRICDGDHEKGEKCDHRRLYWQSTVDALRAENEKLREACRGIKIMFETKWSWSSQHKIDIACREIAAALKETGDE